MEERRSKISVVILTSNSEKTLRQCLEGVRWADEIVVVDDYSRDDTVNICRQYTQNILQNKFEGFAEQKRFAFSKATKEWILSIDADEMVTMGLQNEISRVLQDDPGTIDGYRIPRKNFFLDKWIRYCGWYPDYQLRLFRNGLWKMKEVRVHEYVEIEGQVGFIKEPLLHYSYSTVNEYVARMNKYTSLAAQQMVDEEIKVDTKNMNAIAASKGFETFWKMYIRQKGFKDGMHGLILSIFSAVYKVMVYVKYWEMVEKDVDFLCTR